MLPCRNEADAITECLQSILAQEPPEGGFEVLVADGMSTDGTRELLDEIAANFPQIRVLNNPGRIVSTGLNAAIRAARGNIIIRMDAHTTYAADYIRQCLEVMQETGADNVGGPMRTRAETMLEQAIRAVFHSRFAVGGALSHNVEYEGWVDTVIYGCWKKSTFREVGGFDEELVRNQDDEHNLRLNRNGYRVYQSPRIRSWYRVRGSLSSLFRQYMQYGYWKILVIQKHGAPASWRHVVPGLFLAVTTGLGLWGCGWPPALWAALGLLGAYLLVVLVVSAFTAARSKWKLLPLLPVVFGCFHFGYGYGFLRGVWDFWIFHNAPQTEFVRLTRDRPL